MCVQVTLSAPPRSPWRQIAPAGRKASVEIRKPFSLSFSEKNLFPKAETPRSPWRQIAPAGRKALVEIQWLFLFYAVCRAAYFLYAWVAYSAEMYYNEITETMREKAFDTQKKSTFSLY